MKTPDFRFALRALKYRNYRLFFSGQIVSLIGTWLTTVATSWLVYRLSKEGGATAAHSAFVLGVVGFCSQIPQLVLSPFAGVWVDRWSRHKVLLGTQFLSMLQSFALAFLAMRGLITIPQIIALNFFQGLVNAFDMPARQSLTVDLVERREDLGNAIALSSSMVHSARLVGPAIAGYLIFRFGEGSCFLIDGFSYLAVLLALCFMKLSRRQDAPHHTSMWTALNEGWRYAMDMPTIKALLQLIAFTSIATMSMQVLMPIFANQVLQGGERTYGLLLGASGCGALIGTIYLASRKSVVGLGKVIMWSNFALGVGLLLFSFSHRLALSMIFICLAGGSLMMQIASSNTILQTIIDDSKRGRVMSLFAVSFMGTMPIGSLLTGSIAKYVGPAGTLRISGIACLVSSYFFSKKLPLLRQHVRPIYMKLGLLPATEAIANEPR